MNTQQPQALELFSLDQPVAGTEIFPFLDASRDFFIVHILKTLSLGMGFWTRVCSCPSGATCALWVVCALEISALEHGGGVESITVTDMLKSPQAEERAEAEFCTDLMNFQIAG